MFFKKKKKVEPEWMRDFEPWQKFNLNYHDAIREMENEATELRVKAVHTKDIQDYRELMKAQDKLKEFCYSHGGEGIDYFYNMWEELYNRTTEEYKTIKEKQ